MGLKLHKLFHLRFSRGKRGVLTKNIPWKLEDLNYVGRTPKHVLGCNLHFIGLFLPKISYKLILNENLYKTK